MKIVTFNYFSFPLHVKNVQIEAVLTISVLVIIPLNKPLLLTTGKPLILFLIIILAASDKSVLIETVIGDLVIISSANKIELNPEAMNL